MIDAAGEREEALQRISDIGLNILRRHARIEGRHHDFGQINGGKEVHRHLGKAGNADDEQSQTNYYDEIRIADRKAGHVTSPLTFRMVFDHLGFMRLYSLSG